MLIPGLVLGFSTCCSDKVMDYPCSEAISVTPGKVIEIRYGDSFGFCAGYCWKEVAVTGAHVDFQKGGWNDAVETKSCTRDNSCAEWISLSNKIDVTSFFSLEEVIGCPDCADGGAEWVEIKIASSMHKVTFEYGKAPAEMSAYIGDLRDLASSFANCN